ncbi:MAG: sugar phosphate isomerase/epimerase family protein [Candidatus Bathyarchaeota archaeon]
MKTIKNLSEVKLYSKRFRSILMQTGISTLYLSGKTFKNLVNKISTYSSECKCWEIVDEGYFKLDKKKMDILNQLREKFNLEYTVHAPFVDLNIGSLNRLIRGFSIKVLKNSIFKSNLLNAKVWVFHPGFYGALSRIQPDKAFKMNLKSVSELVEYAEKLGIQTGLENMPANIAAILARAEDFDKFSQAVEFDVKLTLDTGHAHTFGQLEIFLERFKNKIVHVHIHDNDGSFDAHKDIGDGTIYWSKTIEYIHKTGYKNILMVESTNDPFNTIRKLRETIDKMK